MTHEPEYFDNIDDLFAAMERDEVEGARLLSPIEYAKGRSMRPQTVYRYIRTGELGKYGAIERCDCGRRCLVVSVADEFFAEKERKKAGKEISRQHVDSDEE